MFDILPLYPHSTINPCLQWFTGIFLARKQNRTCLGIWLHCWWPQKYLLDGTSNIYLFMSVVCSSTFWTSDKCHQGNLTLKVVSRVCFITLNIIFIRVAWKLLAYQKTGIDWRPWWWSNYAMAVQVSPHLIILDCSLSTSVTPTWLHCALLKWKDTQGSF